jgi:hypothetical protein
MAPFLSLEWGQEGMELMREIKDVFDPTHILNPGVILNDDPRVHVANLKHITPVRCPVFHFQPLQLKIVWHIVTFCNPRSTPLSTHASNADSAKATAQHARQQ